ncbi:MAG: SDR family oxidoreductase [Bacteroidales bacterium]|nr:SDR family oxidoreductase [Bacteroidales bacterium]
MNSNRWNLNGKLALVTGGTKGIGLSVVNEFLDLGASVITVSRTGNDLKKIRRLIDEPGRLETFKADISNPNERNNLIAFIKDQWPHLDILVNNVGMNIRKPITEYSQAEYDKIISTNLHSVFDLTRMAFPLLKLSDQGNVINITSVAGLTFLRTGAIYAMTKAAVIQLTKNLAGEWAKYNIRVNAIAPWYIKTPLVETVLGDPNYLKDVLARTPMKKVGNPEDVSGAVAYLCMPASAYITGHCLNVDGGFMINGF